MKPKKKFLRNAFTRNIFTGKTVSPRRLRAGLALAGALLVGTSAASLYKIEESKPPHELTATLLRHETKNDAKHLEELIKSGIAFGEPYHAIAIEGPDIEHGKMEKFMTDVTAGLEQFKSAHARLVKKGMDDQFPEFSTAIDLFSLKYKLPIIGIEEYTREENKKLKELYKASEVQAEAAQNSATLKEQIAPLEKAESKLFEYIKYRNDRMVEILPRAVSILKKRHPHLSEQTNLRLLGVFGNLHSGIVANEKGPVRIMPSLSPERYDIATFNLIQKRAENPGAKLSEREKIQMVLADNLAPYEHILRRAGDLEKVSLLRSKVAQANQKQFDELDRLTAGKSSWEKPKIIYEYLTGLKSPELK